MSLYIYIVHFFYSSSYWQTVKITFSDGATAEVTLDEPKAARGEGGGELGEIHIVRCFFIKCSLMLKTLFHIEKQLTQSYVLRASISMLNYLKLMHN